MRSGPKAKPTEATEQTQDRHSLKLDDLRFGGDVGVRRIARRLPGSRPILRADRLIGPSSKIRRSANFRGEEMQSRNKKPRSHPSSQTSRQDRARKGKRAMATSAESNDHIAPERLSPEVSNVEKIREILFGGQMRDYDKRFARVDEILAKEIETLRNDLKKRLDTLEAFIHEEVEAANQRVSAERAERTAALKELDRGLREAETTSEKLFTQVEEALSKGTTDLRTRLLEQSKTLTAEIEEKHRALSALLDRDVRTLQEDKTDRAALADLFTELALRLKKDFALPEGKKD